MRRAILFLVFISFLNGASLEFLRIDPFALTSGMAGAFITGDKAEAIYFNPAVLSERRDEKFYASFSYVSWFDNSSKSSFIFLPKKGILKGILVEYFTVSSLKSYDSQGRETGSISYRDLAV
ncbi:MAG: hypothetical protein DRI36_05860, partial [Caldiserica bacterium]